MAFAFACLLTAAPAAAGTAYNEYSYDSELRFWVHNSLESASISQGFQTKRIAKAVYVRCYWFKEGFEQALIRRGESRADVRYVIAYYAGGSTINMRASTCSLARQFTDNGLVTQNTAGAFATLLHEALHRQGLRDERVVEAAALASMYDAGQLIAYQRRTGRDYETWEACFPEGLRAARLAWQQARKYAAAKHLVSWPRVNWYYTNFNWADVLTYGLAD